MKLKVKIHSNRFSFTLQQQQVLKRSRVGDIVTHKAGWEAKMALTFLNEMPIYNPDRETVRVIGVASSGHVVCRVAKTALLAYEQVDDASPSELLEIFTKHRRRIEQVARDKFLTGGQQADGSIMILST